MSGYIPTRDDDSEPINISFGSLRSIYNKYFDGTWPDMDTSHSYLDVYHELLEPYRLKAKNILEIGLFTGARLKIWKEYFNGDVHGIDCDEQPHGGMADLRPMIQSGEYNIHIMDAMDKTKAKKEFGKTKFDVIIEDAGHSLESQVEIYSVFKSFLSGDGIYIIEDVQNLDRDRETLLNLKPGHVEIIDRRSKKLRYDDVLVVIK